MLPKRPEGRAMPGLFAFGSYQRPARDRPRHRLPQHRRRLERDRLGRGHAGEVPQPACFPLVPQRLLNAGPVMTPGGPLLASVRAFGRMSQTSTERLRDYLAQLPPQAQALLMREFERAIERGEDVSEIGRAHV